MLTEQQKQILQESLERLTLEKKHELAEKGWPQDRINNYIEDYREEFQVGYVIGAIESLCGLVRSKAEGMDIPDEFIREMFGCEPYEAKAICECCGHRRVYRGL